MGNAVIHKEAMNVVGAGIACALCAHVATALPSVLNCTWRYETQSLDHFNMGQAKGATFTQRVCYYEGFVQSTAAKDTPVLFYTGNESPVDIYVNSTGLMWTLGEKLGALLVFAEHRYFGESMPTLKGVPYCLSYLTSAQALADYAVLVTNIKRRYELPNAAVVAFGGSYGGMLSAWMRFKYPNIIDGAIAASAPIWGFPLTSPPLDGAFQSVTRGATQVGGAQPMCAQTMVATYPIIMAVAQSAEGREALMDALSLCTPLKSANEVHQLIDYLQQPWFLLAEGDFPFASDYIPFAVGPGNFDLPPWPMRVACDHLKGSPLSVSGSLSKVDFTVTAGENEYKVDWDRVTGAPGVNKQVRIAPEQFSQAVGVWYNVSKQERCYDWKVPDPSLFKHKQHRMHMHKREVKMTSGPHARKNSKQGKRPGSKIADSL